MQNLKFHGGEEDASFPHKEDSCVEIFAKQWTLQNFMILFSISILLKRMSSNSAISNGNARHSLNHYYFARENIILSPVDIKIRGQTR